jgi:tRNA threonylcarbamoyladenosine biosynthesis protein TsaE
VKRPAARTSAGAEETERFGAELAGELSGGDVVLIKGELGAGKTTFVRGACRALGVEEAVTSPTFTIGKTYEAGGASISHLDLYRLGSLAVEDPALLEDYLGSDRIAFVEWPPEGDEAELLTVEGTLRTVTIEAQSDGSRSLVIE